MDNKNEVFLRNLFLNIIFLFIGEGIGRLIDNNKKRWVN